MKKFYILRINKGKLEWSPGYTCYYRDKNYKETYEEVLAKRFKTKEEANTFMNIAVKKDMYHDNKNDTISVVEFTDKKGIQQMIDEFFESMGSTRKFSYVRDELDGNYFIKPLNGFGYKVSHNFTWDESGSLRMEFLARKYGKDNKVVKITKGLIKKIEMDLSAKKEKKRKETKKNYLIK